MPVAGSEQVLLDIPIRTVDKSRADFGQDQRVLIINHARVGSDRVCSTTHDTDGAVHSKQSVRFADLDRF